MTGIMQSDLIVLRNLKMKPNYSELARKYGIKRQTIAKYDKGFVKKEKRSRISMLDPYKNEIKEKINLPGATVTGVYKYFCKKKAMGTRSNFAYYVKKHELIEKKKKYYF